MRDLNSLKVLNDKAQCAWLLKEVKRRGGLTLNNTFEVVEHKSGYQVSIIDCFKVDFKTLTADKLYSMLSNHNIKDSGKNIGLWLHESMLYVDLSEKIDDFLTAFDIAQVRQQLAIYDWFNGVDIKTDWIDKTFNDLKNYLDAQKLDSENYITLGDNVAYSIMNDNNEVYCDCEEVEETTFGIEEAFKKSPIKAIRVNTCYYSDIDYQKALIYIHI